MRRVQNGREDVDENQTNGQRMRKNTAQNRERKKGHRRDENDLFARDERRIKDFHTLPR